MPQQSTPGPITTITFLVLGIISSIIAILMVPALFHEVTSLRAAAFTEALFSAPACSRFSAAAPNTSANSRFLRCTEPTRIENAN